VRGDFDSHPAQKEQLITAHIIGPEYVKPSSSQSLVIAHPCKQRRRSASRLRSRAVKLHGIRTSTCSRHEDPYEFAEFSISIRPLILGLKVFQELR